MNGYHPKHYIYKTAENLPKSEYGERPVRFVTSRVGQGCPPEIVEEQLSYWSAAQHVLISRQRHNIIVDKFTSERV